VHWSSSVTVALAWALIEKLADPEHVTAPSADVPEMVI
jgi:hypothetical protein